MCLECRVLGALAHHNKKGVQFLVHKFSNLDFRPLPSEVKDYLVDLQSESYLQATLDLIKNKCGVELKVIKVDSDGSCLPYAVSRCLIGKEILYDCLRQALSEELASNEEFYSKTFRQGMDDATWKIHWTQILDEAKPTRGMRTGRWLGPGEHLVGMANVLARPILLLDELGSMQRFDGVSCGLFLPSRLSRQQVLDRNFGQVPSPIVIAWASEKRNHFVSLIRTATPKQEGRDIFLDDSFLPTDLAVAIERSCFKSEGKQKTARNELRGMEMPIQVPPTGPNEYVSLKDSETNEEIKIAVPPGVKPGSTFQAKFMRPPAALERCWMRLFLENSKTSRTRVFQTLKLVVENIVDAFLSGDFNKIAKVSKLKLDNAMVKANILCASGGLEFLLAAGFQRTNDEQIIEFNGFDEKLINIRDALRLCVTEGANVRDIEGEVSAGMETELFGPRPACFFGDEMDGEKNDPWSQAREMFGFDGPDTSVKTAAASRRTAGVWIFSANGILREQERKKLVDSLMAGVRKDFDSVSKNSELAKVDWDDVIMYNKRLMHVKCAACEQDQEWTGPVDGMNSELHVQQCSKCSKPLKAEMTGARKLLSFVGACAVDGPVGGNKMRKVRDAQSRKREMCHLCCIDVKVMFHIVTIVNKSPCLLKTFELRAFLSCEKRLGLDASDQQWHSSGEKILLILSEQSQNDASTEEGMVQGLADYGGSQWVHGKTADAFIQCFAEIKQWLQIVLQAIGNNLLDDFPAVLIRSQSHK